MAKKNVVEITCERCSRVEHVDPSAYADVPDLDLRFGSKPSDAQPEDGPTCYQSDMCMKFEDLCSSCKKTVRNLVEQIGKKISWKRAKDDESEAKKEEEGAGRATSSPRERT